MSKLLTGMMALSLSACVAIPDIKTAQEIVRGDSPDMGDISVAEIGGAIYSKFSYTRNPVAVLTDQVTFKDITIPSDARFYAMHIEGLLSWCGEYQDPLVSGHCLIDSDNDGWFDKRSKLSGSFIRTLPNPAPYTKEYVISNIVTGYKYELIYQGVVDNKISIAYREYTDNLARPAFTQQAQYELNNDGTAIIGFKGARVQVHRADNLQIEYTVNQGFAQ